MDYIQVTKPGNYKPRKTEPKGRYCLGECGTRLSIYNSMSYCSQCHNRMFDLANGENK